MPHATPIVFLVDDDISVRESLESLIRCAGWHPEIFASAQGIALYKSLHRPQIPLTVGAQTVHRVLHRQGNPR
jgi:FixJ family two-component response regulator